MRMAEVDQSGYLRAKRAGKLAYKDKVSAKYINTTVTSGQNTLAAGSGMTITINYATPAGYSFNGISAVTSNHGFACSIGGFRRDGVNGKCYVDITNRNASTSLTDLTVSMGLSFVRIETE